MPHDKRMFSRAERHKFPDWKGSCSTQQNEFRRLTPVHSTCFLNTLRIKGSSQKLPGRGGKITSKWIRSPNGFELLSATPETPLITPNLKLYAQPHHFSSPRLFKNLPLRQLSQEFTRAGVLQAKRGNKTRKRKRHRTEGTNAWCRGGRGRSGCQQKAESSPHTQARPGGQPLPVGAGRKKVLGGLL